MGMPGTNGTVMGVRQEIRQFVVQNFLFGQDQNLDEGASFLEAGIIDSTGVLELVAHLEETYDIKVKDDELIPDNLDSIDAIVAYLARKRGASGQEA
jgi:acyl carrier protein